MKMTTCKDVRPPLIAGTDILGFKYPHIRKPNNDGKAPGGGSGDSEVVGMDGYEGF